MNQHFISIMSPRFNVGAAASMGSLKKEQVSSVSLKALSLPEFLAADFPPRTMLMAPWLPEGGIAMIYASRGVGKTFLALAVAYAIACGGSALGWKAPEPQRVLYIDGEMPAVVLQERLRKIIGRDGAQLPAPEYLRILASDTHRDGLPDLATREGQAQFNAMLGDAKLIIVDNLSTLCRSGRENEAESWLPVQEWALQMRREGRSVLFIHHAGKNGSQRGTSRKEDVLDTVMALKRPENYNSSEGARFEVHFEKARGFAGPDSEPIEAMLTDVGWTWRPLEDALADQVIALRRDGLSQREIAKEVDTSPATVNRILKKAAGKS